MREALLAQVEHLQAQAMLLASQINAFKKLIEASLPVPAPAEPEEDADGRCLHPVPYRVPAVTSGHQTRFACRRCKQWGGLTESSQESIRG